MLSVRSVRLQADRSDSACRAGQVHLKVDTTYGFRSTFLRISTRSRRSAAASGSAADAESAARACGRAADAEAVLHGTPRADNSLLQVFSQRAIFGALAAERLQDRHVPFVARVGKDAIAV